MAINVILVVTILNRPIAYLLFLSAVLFATNVKSQGQGNWWYFGQNAGLNFNTNPPTSVTGSLVTQEGCSSLSDPNGTLLMYTDGSTVYNSAHVVMANGTGLAGNFSTAQSGVIVQQPGSNTNYFIFTMGVSNLGSLQYSIVDMSLAAGMGSVTTKNVNLYGPCLEKLTAVKHSNNIDVWVLVHESGPSTQFRAYLLTSTGVNNTAVISNIGTSGTTQSIGYLRASPNGLNVASGFYGGSGIELYDFNRTTGVLSNPVTLNSGHQCYGVEFSPDGTKLYGSSTNKITQWSICSGNSVAIAASAYSFATSDTWAMQLGPDAKIYVSRYQTSWLGIINNPNVAGIGCNYVSQGLSVSPNICRLGLPNYVTSWFQPTPAQFTTAIGTSSNIIGCMSASFTSPSTLSMTLPGCTSLSSSVTGLSWNFGDPNSGSANTSNLSHPLHMFSGLGTYTVSMFLYYSNNYIDTVQNVVVINQPCISVSSSSITCASLGSATVAALGGLGPFSYTWMPSNQTGSVATGLNPGTYSISVFDQGNNYTYTAQTIFVSVIPLSGQLANQSSVACFGAATATASIYNLAGGSGTQTYVWSNGSSVLTGSLVNTISTGLWTVTVTDALSSCQLQHLFYVSQPAASTVYIAASHGTLCAGSIVNFTATAGGGAGGHIFQWVAGPATETLSSTRNASGTYVYTVVATDQSSCAESQTVAVDFIANPTISVQNASICPLQTATVTASGATTYTWNTGNLTAALVASPSSNTTYTVTGETALCTSTATGLIVVLPVPPATIGSNGPKCEGQNLQLTAGGGNLYSWTGPNNFSSAQANPLISQTNLLKAGVYNVTVSAVNGCTASLQHTVVIYPTPTISIFGNTVCVGQTLNFSANSLPGSSYSWSGPVQFNSNLQSPSISMASVNQSGNYLLNVTSGFGCTNTAVTHNSVVAPPISAITVNDPVCEGENLILSGSQSSGYASLQWQGPNNFLSSQINNTITNVIPQAAGIYQLTLFKGPCVISFTRNVVVNALPIPAIQYNAPLCETKTLVLTASSQGAFITKYKWTGPGFNSSAQNPLINTVNISNTGLYALTVTDINGCAGTTSKQIDVLKNPVIYTKSDTVCLGDTAYINATGADTYQWYGKFIYDQYNASAVIAPTIFKEPENYLVIGTGVNGCTSTAVAQVVTRELPKPTINMSPSATLCINQIIRFTGTGGTSYHWEGPTQISLTGATPTLQMRFASYGGIYTLTVADKYHCKGSTTKEVRVNALPNGSLIEDQVSHCVPFCTNFKFEPSYKTSDSLLKVSWTIQNKKITGTSFQYCFNTAGDHVLIGTFRDLSTGCVGTQSYNVNALPQPVADFEWLPELPLELEDVSFINKSKTSADAIFEWYLTKKEPVSRNENFLHLFEDPGVYPVAFIVQNNTGCRDTVLKTVIVEPDFAFYMPNTFTPDDDNLNEVFKPVVRGVKKFTLQIFNRWGELIYKSDESSPGWDGFVNGKPAEQNVYAWKAIVVSNTGVNKSFSGQVNLLR